MKVCWLSNASWSGTGYGQQTAQVLDRLVPRYGADQVAGIANFGLGGGPMRDPKLGIRWYPTGWTPHSDDVAPIHAMHFLDGKPGIVFTLYDVWVFRNEAWRDVPLVASWTPVDHYPLPPAVAKWFHTFGAVPLAMSRFGERALEDANLEPLYVPHGIDTATFRPGSRKKARKKIGIPETAFVVGMVGANKGNAPSRKAFAEQFRAFSLFHQRHPDSLLYVHAEQFGTTEGIDLGDLAKGCGIPDDALMFTDPYSIRLAQPAMTIATLYQSFDVLTAASYGEGFGIPVVEAQACGIPVVVNDFSAQPELLGAGWAVPGQEWWDHLQRAWYQVPSIDAIAAAYEAAYQRDGKTVMVDSRRARDHALGYDSDAVWSNHWVPILDELEQRLPDMAPVEAIPVVAA